MSRFSIMLDRSEPESAAPLPRLEAVPRSGDYLDLVRRLSPVHPVIAVIDAGAGSRGPEACRGIAAELAAAGKRVVIVQVDALVRLSHPPDATACIPGQGPNVSLWPAGVSTSVDFFHTPSPVSVAADWLPSLRRLFESVILYCPPVETEPAAASIAAMATAAVLVVDAGHTTKEQIQHDQQALEMRGVKLTGCILMRRR